MVIAPDDIAALIEAGAESMYGKNWNGPPDKRPGEEMKDVWRGYTRDALKPALTILAAQQAEIERLRTRLECDGTNMAGERVSVEPYDGIAVRDVMIADLRADLAARDETIRGLRERTLTDDDLYTLMCAAENLRSADHDESRADAAFRIASQIDKLRARNTEEAR